MSTENTSFSRRTLAKGAAWAVPAVAVAAAAPAMAKSGLCLEYNFNGTNACKSPGSGNRFYHLVLKICNTCTSGSITVTFRVAKLQLNNGTILTPCTGTALPVDVSEPIAAGKCAEVDLGWFYSTSGNPSKIYGYNEAGEELFSASAPPDQATCECPA